MESITVRQDGERVLLLKNGVLIGDLPYQTALILSDVLRTKGKQAEEVAKAEQVISDSALLIRSGAPFGLSSNKNILSEAIKEAAHNRSLRRFLPGGIKSREVFGRPTITQHPSKGRHNGEG